MGNLGQKRSEATGAEGASGKPRAEENRGQGAEGASRQPRIVEKRGKGAGEVRPGGRRGQRNNLAEKKRGQGAEEAMGNP